MVHIRCDDKNHAHRPPHLPPVTGRRLWTFRALVDRVVDGDTLRIRADLGFHSWTVERLRLRGIDAAHLDSKAGQRARDRVQELFAICGRTSHPWLASRVVPYQGQRAPLTGPQLPRSAYPVDSASYNML